jgi:hypothetical protein
MGRANARDLIAAGIFVAIGLFYCIYAWFELSIGEALRMGPGYFPIVVGLLLIFCGALVALEAAGSVAHQQIPIPWRGMILVTAAIVYFGATIRGLGLLPALSGSLFIAGYATAEATFLAVAALSIGLTAFCALVFNVALGLPIDLLGSWIR